jgi:hypothetical protein
MSGDRVIDEGVDMEPAAADTGTDAGSLDLSQKNPADIRMPKG